MQPSFTLRTLDFLLYKLRASHVSCEHEGFPHSEISGSKVARHLPEAYRSYATSFIAFSSQGIHHTPLTLNLHAHQYYTVRRTTRIDALRSYTYICAFVCVVLTLKLQIEKTRLCNFYLFLVVETRYSVINVLAKLQNISDAQQCLFANLSPTCAQTSQNIIFKYFRFTQF